MASRVFRSQTGSLLNLRQAGRFTGGEVEALKGPKDDDVLVAGLLQFQIETVQQWYSYDDAVSCFPGIEVSDITGQDELALKRKEPHKVPNPARFSEIFMHLHPRFAGIVGIGSAFGQWLNAGVGPRQ